MSELVVDQENERNQEIPGSRSARRVQPRPAQVHAQAVLRIRSWAAGLALLPAAAAVVLGTGGATGSLGAGWDTARAVVCAVAAVVLLLAGCVGAVIARARPAVTPTVDLEERAAPDLHNLVRDLADRLDVPAPSAIALTPDCDSWLEDRSHPRVRDRVPARIGNSSDGRSVSPVLVIGSPFLWWMRVAELRSLLAPVVAGTGPSAHPDIAAARRFVHGLDAACAVARKPRHGSVAGALAAPVLRLAGFCARWMLRAAGPHAAEMERGVATASSARARTVGHELRHTAQEQVGLAYAGWDRLLTRVALPAWRIGRWPSRLDAGVVASLTELSRRDSLAGDFTFRLDERPACDLLEDPGGIDGRISLLAARLFHAGPREEGPDWSPVSWQEYPEEVVDRIWRTEASRLFRALDTTGAPVPAGAGARGERADGRLHGPTLARLIDRLSSGADQVEALAACVTSASLREETQEDTAGSLIPGAGEGPAAPLGLPLPPRRTGEELLADHLRAAVCCAAVDTAGAAPGLDWLDGPVLRDERGNRRDPRTPVLALVETGDPEPLREWLNEAGVRADKPVRLV